MSGADVSLALFNASAFDDDGVTIIACRLTRQWTRTLNFGIVSISSVRYDCSGCDVHNIGAAESRFHKF